MKNKNNQLKNLNLEPSTLAKFFYQKGIDTSPIIQKLIYFAYLEGIKQGCLLFKEEFEAWEHGPVLPSLFTYSVKKSGFQPLEKTLGNFPNLENKNALEILEQTYAKYSSYQDWEEVIDMARNFPWQLARSRKEDNRIKLEDLIAFVKSAIVKEKILSQELGRVAAFAV